MSSLVCKYCGRPRLRRENVCSNCRYLRYILSNHDPGKFKVDWEKLLEDAKIQAVEWRLDRSR